MNDKLIIEKLERADEFLARMMSNVIRYDKFEGYLQQLKKDAVRLKTICTDVELLINQEPNEDTSPQLNKHDVIGWQDFDEQKMIEKAVYITKLNTGDIHEIEYSGRNKDFFLNARPKVFLPPACP